MLANIALSALDEYFDWQRRQYMGNDRQRAKRRRHGQGNWKIIRYADDFVLMVSGDRHHAEALREEVAAVLAPLGLRLSPEKTRVVHIDEGFDFLGFQNRRMRKRGTSKQYVYTTPSRKSIQSIKDKVSELTYRSTRYQDLAQVITSLNQALAGSPGVPSPLHDVAVKRFTESFCNTSAKCGARCRRCSEPCRRGPATCATPLTVVGDELTPLRPARSAGTHAMPVLHPERSKVRRTTTGPGRPRKLSSRWTATCGGNFTSGLAAGTPRRAGNGSPPATSARTARTGATGGSSATGKPEPTSTSTPGRRSSGTRRSRQVYAL